MDNDVLDVEPVKNIIDATIEDEMQRSYIDYSMSVIVSRALPDVRDGLKPVQRRILYGMNELGLHYNKKEMKCARIVGEVMGKFHPHGDSSIYLALVRMAQSFSFRYPLINGQGNFGNIDMGPAAMRYTEAKMQKMSDDILADINKDTVDFRGNYDDTLQEPEVLPARIPNLLINGAQGIAVGLATLIPPHNITEVLNGVLALLEDPDIGIEGVKADIENGIEAKKGLIDYVTAPDFPTGGIIYGYAGIKSMYLTGRGRVVVRGKVHYEESKRKGDRHRLVIDEIPYQVGRNNLIDKLIELHKDKKIEGIFDVINESGKTTRIVIELKKDANHEIITNLLFKYTQLQVSIGGNIVALVNGKPMQLNLKQILSLFISHREEVITRRTKFELRKAQARIHILEGLKIAQDNIDEVIKIIRASKTVDMAKQGLVSAFDLSDIQATAIVTMRLGQLTGLEIEKILNEMEELRIKIEDFEDILERKERRMEVIREETIEVSEKYQDERKSEIVHYADDLTVEDMIPNDEMIVMISHQGYIKRVASTEFKTQNRGGIGSKGSDSKDSDFIEFIFNASNHDYLMFFTDTGKVYWKKVWRLPEMSKQSKGRPIVNIIERVQGEKIKAVIKVTDFELDGKYLVMSTKNGIIKKTVLKAYSRPNKGGIIAINLRDNDELLDVRITSGEDEIILGTKSGYANRFNETNVREVGRNSIGVKGINLREDDEVVGMIISKEETDTLLVVSENGYGKRSIVEAFRKTSRGSKGVRALNTTDKTGKMIALVKAGNDSDLMIITSNGIVIKQNVENIRVMGRNTQGVKLISVRDKDMIADVCITPKIEEEPVVIENSEIENAEGENEISNTEVNTEAQNKDENTEITNQNDESEIISED